MAAGFREGIVSKELVHLYVKNRMNAIAPNLTIIVGELVGAMMILHAGSLINLAKYPSSTVQILGAEKSYIRALSTTRNTPKHGIIYHASLVEQTPDQYKGKIARMLSAKASLAVRCDVFSDGVIYTEHAMENVVNIEKEIENILELYC